MHGQDNNFTVVHNPDAWFLVAKGDWYQYCYFAGRCFAVVVDHQNENLQEGKQRTHHEHGMKQGG